MKPVLALLWRPVRAVLLALAALVLAIEEWGWRPLTAWAARLARWAPVARLEAHIRSASPRTALLLFLVPAAALFPVKLVALWFIHLGHAVLGIAIIVAAKLLGTALVGRLFIITEPQLMTYAWFAHALGWWRATKLRVKQALRNSSGWQAASRARRRIAVLLRRMTRQAR
ncbi:MAG TPA: hypothetical protein VKI18_12630 [Albitalea sp.]|nr:hypothetical protein [Albitalea sp.]